MVCRSKYEVSVFINMVINISIIDIELSLSIWVSEVCKFHLFGLERNPMNTDLAKYLIVHSERKIYRIHFQYLS